MTDFHRDRHKALTVVQRVMPLAIEAADTSSPPRERSFDAVYEAQLDFVFRCLRRMGLSSASAEDACQDTFIVLHRRLGDLRPDASERAFLFAIATRVAREYRRKHARTPSVPLLDEPPARPDALSPYDDIVNAQAAARIERFLATLDVEQRVVFMLMELEDFRAPEVCEALGMKLNTVYSRLRLARARFNAFVQQEGLIP